MRGTSPNMIDETGHKYGRLTVIRVSPIKINNRLSWLCDCDCGARVVVTGKSMRMGETQSCGCLKRELVSWRSFMDETGNRYGKLTVLEFSETRKNLAYWKCLCDCGRETVVSGNSLRHGGTKSCGCSKSPLGDKSGNWRGGVVIDKRGYVYKIQRNHPRAKHNLYVQEHILVMETMIGRYVLKTEIVHHKNGKKGDNNPFNLWLFPSKAAHVKHHAEVRKCRKKP